MDATRFGLFVAEMRKENHMTQAELAAKTGRATSRETHDSHYDRSRSNIIDFCIINR